MVASLSTKIADLLQKELIIQEIAALHDSDYTLQLTK